MPLDTRSEFLEPTREGKGLGHEEGWLWAKDLLEGGVRISSGEAPRGGSHGIKGKRNLEDWSRPCRGSTLQIMRDKRSRLAEHKGYVVRVANIWILGILRGSWKVNIRLVDVRSMEFTDIRTWVFLPKRKREITTGETIALQKKAPLKRRSAEVNVWGRS